MKIKNSLIKWKILLNDFNFDIKEIAGKDNCIADELSRMNLMREIKDRSKFSAKIKEYIIIDKDDKDKNLIKEVKEIEFLKLIHKTSQHAGVQICFYNIHKYFKIKNLVKKLQEVIRTCKKCKIYKNISKKDYNKVHIIAKEPFERVSSDIYGPFDMRKYVQDNDFKKGYFITMIYIYSRITYIRFLSNITEDEVIKTYKKWIKKYGNPRIIITDNGLQYKSDSVHKFIDKKGIEFRHIPAYTPESNGISERINLAITEVLRMNKGKHIKKIRKKNII